MAYAIYYQWDSLGRPLEPARPIRDIVERIKAAYPKAASTFSWYANEAHYQAEPPQDHTPFSATGWPKPSPEWWVFATDIMHRVDLGVDCNVLFGYWIGEARAGRMPWLKYMIWQAKLYDVRNGWRAQSNSGHFDHIHLSARTDFQHYSLGSWSIVPLPPPEADMPKLFIVTDSTPPDKVCISDGATRRWLTDDVDDVMYKWGLAFPTERVTMAQADAYYGPDIDTLRGEPGPAGPPGPATLVPHKHDFDGSTGGAVADDE